MVGVLAGAAGGCGEQDYREGEGEKRVLPRSVSNPTFVQ
jgi:hypothetical protein